MKPFTLAAVLSFIPLTSQGAITVTINSAMSAIEQQTFVDAAAYWNSVIIGYKNTYNSANQITPIQLNISATLEAIDNAGGVLGSAGPTSIAYYDNSPIPGLHTSAIYYAVAGQMKFDSADVANMITNNTFYGVVLHEMAHVLGVGTLWNGFAADGNNIVGGINNNLYTTPGQYTGANGLAAWQNEFDQLGASFVPVELEGGPGTAGGHWDEVDFDAGNTGYVSNITGLDFRNELMTGWASNTFFLSTVTIGALEDLGYVVDYTKAGVINHTVVIPEPSTLVFVFGTLPLLGMRRRKA